ncbi:MAG: T9SS C-terminal target domain-containing protein [Bacteroidetes bacterium]|nr:MAG: T9SS C-terminal target domain-containing protein [Bacteroidota bacterium]
MLKHSKFFLPLIFVLLFSYLHSYGSSQDTPLIVYHSAEKLNVEEALHFFEQRDVVMRFAKVELNPMLKSGETLKTDEEITLNLFEDIFYTAAVNRSERNINGTTSISARIQETQGYVVITHHEGRSLATIYLPTAGMFYKIISDPVTLEHYLIEMDARDRDILESAPPIIPELKEEGILEQKRIQEHLKNQDLGPNDWANVDVMVLYTTGAEFWGENFGGGIENVIAAAMANAQLVLDNSETLMTVTLVHSEVLNFTETGNTGSDLGTFAQSGPIQNLRNEYYADLVAVFARVSDVGGVGYLLTTRNGRPEIGYSVTRVQQAASGYTHIHEMGHNMGCHHHWQQNFQPGPTIWTDWPENYWSGGWRWQGTDGGYYCSVMTYTSGSFFDDGITHTEVPYFSNPDVLHMNVPAGDFNYGNNALTLREVKHVIASYRISDLATIFTTPISEIGLISAKTGGEITHDGGRPVLQRGVVWSTFPNPTLENNEGMIEKGQGTGAFEIILEDLSPSTDYYVSAYATTEAGVSYGVQRTFQTEVATMARVRTEEMFSISYNSARAGGEVLETGNSNVSQRGLVWNTRSSPSLANNVGFTIDGEGEGGFESMITGLEPETEYYFRAYATNLGGTVYGTTYTFTTLFARIYPNPFTDRIQVEFKNDSQKDVNILITDTRGQVVIRMPVSEQGDVQRTVNVAHLEGGIYLLTVESEIEFPVWQMLKLGR